MHVYSAREDQIEALADLAGAAFENYPLHTAVKGLLAEPEKFSDWIRDLHVVMIRVFVRYHTVLVLEDQGKILGVALLNRRPPGLLEYLRYCRPLLRYMRFDRLVRFFSFTEAADSVVRKASDFQWFLTVIAVDPEFQHRGIGRLFLERGIEGYIRSHWGRLPRIYYLHPKECTLLFECGIQNCRRAIGVIRRERCACVVF